MYWQHLSSATPPPRISRNWRPLGWALFIVGWIALSIGTVWFMRSPIESTTEMVGYSALLISALACLWYGSTLVSRSPVGIGGGLIFVILLLITRFLSGINAIAMILFSFGSNVKASDSPGIIASTLMLQVGAEFVLLVMAVSVFVLMMRWHRGFSRAFIVLLVVSLLIGVAWMIWFGYLQYLGYYVSSLLVDAEVRTVSSAIALIAFLLYRRYSHRIRETFTR